MKSSKNFFVNRIKSLRIWTLAFFFMHLTYLPARSQSDNDLLNKKISIRLSNVSTTEVLSAIEKEAGCIVSYSINKINTSNRISVDYNNISVREALNRLLGNRLNGIRISGNQLFLQMPSAEKGIVKGTVYTSDGEAAEGVTVKLNGTGYGTIAGKGGFYELKAPEGDYSLIVSFTGLKPQSRDIRIAAQKTRIENFTLVENESALREVVVNGQQKRYLEEMASVGTKLPASVREIPHSITVIGRQLMNDLNYTTVSDAVQMASGTTIIANGDRGQSWAAFARGYAMPVQNEGIPSQSSFSLVAFDLSMYQQVEVLQGPAGVLQGAGEAGGVINLVRKRAAENFGWEGSISAGSWNNYRADAGVTGALNKKKTIRGRLNIAGQSQNFFYERAHQNLGFGYGMLEFDIDKKTVLSLSGSLQTINITHGFTGLPEILIDSLSRSANLNLDWQYSKPKIHEELLQITRQLAEGWRLNVSVKYSGSGSHVKNGFIVGNTIDPVKDSAQYMQNEFDKLYTYSAGADINLTGKFKLIGQSQQVLIGANYDWYKSKNVMGGFKRTGNVYIPHPDVPEPDYEMTMNNQTLTKQLGIYAQVRFKPAKPLTLLLGSRISNYFNKTRNISTDWKSDPDLTGKFTPYAGIVYDINRYLTAYVSYASIFSPQQTYLTFQQQPLKPRTGWQIETGIKSGVFNDKLQASLAAFYMKDRNRALVDAANSGESQTYYISAGVVVSKGIDFQVSGSPFPGLNMIAGYNYLDAKYDKDVENNEGKSFDLLEPANQIKIWANYTFINSKLKNFNLGLGTTFQSKFANYSGTVWQSSYALLNAQLGYKLSRNYSASFTLNNILDKKYFQTVNAFYYGTPSNFMLAVRKSI